MYEEGMQMIWDVVAKRITVVFRGNIIVLPVQFPDQEAGILAGEAYCKRHGWQP